jgi:hypothetical protein
MASIPDPTEFHRAGYHKDKLPYVMAWILRHPDATLTSGEGKILVDEIHRLRNLLWDNLTTPVG